MAELFTNNAATTLNGSITSGDLTLVVTSATAFPTTGSFQILLEAEIITVSAVSGTTFTIVRAREGTAATAHSNGVAVTHILTAGGLRTVAGISAPYPPMPAIVDSDYSWINQGSSTITVTNGVARLYDPSTSGVTARFKTLSPASNYTALIAFKPFAFATGGNFGLYLRDSGNGKIINFTFDWSGGFSIDVGKYNSATSFSAGYGPSPGSAIGLIYLPVMWFRIVDDGTNRLYSVSCNGNDFTQVLSTLRTDWITPDQIGFGIDNNTNSEILVYTLSVA